MIELGPNLTAVLLALVAILSLLAQGYISGKHAENVQKNGDLKALVAKSPTGLDTSRQGPVISDD